MGLSKNSAIPALEQHFFGCLARNRPAAPGETVAKILAN
jgi:hypothetical protein